MEIVFWRNIERGRGWYIYYLYPPCSTQPIGHRKSDTVSLRPGTVEMRDHQRRKSVEILLYNKYIQYIHTLSWVHRPPPPTWDTGVFTWCIRCAINTSIEEFRLSPTRLLINWPRGRDTPRTPHSLNARWLIWLLLGRPINNGATTYIPLKVRCFVCARSDCTHPCGSRACCCCWMCNIDRLAIPQIAVQRSAMASQFGVSTQVKGYEYNKNGYYHTCETQPGQRKNGIAPSLHYWDARYLVTDYMALNIMSTPPLWVEWTEECDYYCIWHYSISWTYPPPPQTHLISECNEWKNTTIVL